jgi:hypothetical protein
MCLAVSCFGFFFRRFQPPVDGVGTQVEFRRDIFDGGASRSVGHCLQDTRFKFWSVGSVARGGRALLPSMACLSSVSLIHVLSV